MQDMSNFEIIKGLIFYLLIINTIGFFTMWSDKKSAQNGTWRISERALLLIALAGGSIGSLIGMYKFRHKTKHFKFVYGIPLIIILQISLIFIYKFKLYIPIFNYLKNSLK